MTTNPSSSPSMMRHHQQSSTIMMATHKSSSSIVMMADHQSSPSHNMPSWMQLCNHCVHIVCACVCMHVVLHVVYNCIVSLLLPSPGPRHHSLLITQDHTVTEAIVACKIVTQHLLALRPHCHGQPWPETETTLPWPAIVWHCLWGNVCLGCTASSAQHILWLHEKNFGCTP